MIYIKGDYADIKDMFSKASIVCIYNHNILASVGKHGKCEVGGEKHNLHLLTACWQQLRHLLNALDFLQLIVGFVHASPIKPILTMFLAARVGKDVAGKGCASSSERACAGQGAKTLST